MAQTMTDWMIVRESIASCGIEGIWFEKLVDYVNRWLMPGKPLNRKELDWLSRFMDGTLK